MYKEFSGVWIMAYTTIDDPSKHMQVLTYRGDSTSTTTADRTLTNDGNSNLQPDLVWIFNRDTATNSGQRLWDSTRGVGQNKGIQSNSNGSEGIGNDPEYGYVNTLHSDGFGVRAGANDSNGRWTTDRGEGGGDKYVAFQWKANGGTTTSATTTGGIASATRQVDSTNKFSIIGYTSASSQAVGTIEHGLGVKPEFMMIKRRPNNDDWVVYHHKNTTAPETELLKLNSTAATTDITGPWNDTAPTSSVFTLGALSDSNEGSGETYICYAWAGVQGYSKFGRYEGNGQSNGTFIVTGFKPAWVMVKNTESTESWVIYNDEMPGYNQVGQKLAPNLVDDQIPSGIGGPGYNDIDIYSNGFKYRTNNGATNENDADFVYAAFAKEPLVTSGGVPATAE